MEKTLIRKTLFGPEKVLEDDDVHYFYWRAEFGVGYVKIWKYRIPLFPVKFLDYEPVKTLIHDKKLVVISRFHYHILTYFNRPIFQGDLPIVDFSFGSHTPVIITNIGEDIHHGFDKRFPIGVDTREIAAFEALLGFLQMILMRKIEHKAEELTTYDVSPEGVPQDCILRSSDMLAIVWLGDMPTREEFEAVGYRYK